jgi:hypothetical protein
MRAMPEWHTGHSEGRSRPPARVYPFFRATADSSAWYVMTNVTQSHMNVIGSMSTCTLRSPLGRSAALSQKRI